MIVIDDAAGMTKYMWEYLDTVVIGGEMETVVIGGEMETVEAISIFDEYNKLKAENNRLREENYDLTLTFLLSKEKAADEIVKLRQVLQQITELSPFKFNTGHASLQYITQRLVEMTALAHEALKEKA
jgi:hypothetical protein